MRKGGGEGGEEVIGENGPRDGPYFLLRVRMHRQEEYMEGEEGQFKKER